MQEVLVLHPRLGLTTDLAFHAVAPSRRCQRGVLSEMLDQVLDDDRALGDDRGLAGTCGLDADDRGLSEWVDLFQLRRCEHGLRVAMEDFELVGELQLFEQPENALRAGLVEPGNSISLRDGNSG